MFWLLSHNNGIYIVNKNNNDDSCIKTENTNDHQVLKIVIKMKHSAKSNEIWWIVEHFYFNNNNNIHKKHRDNI